MAKHQLAGVVAMKLLASLFSFEGRIGRLAFVGLFLPVFLVPQPIGKVILQGVQEEWIPSQDLYTLAKPVAFLLAILLMASCVSLAAIVTKRLHDLGDSGWPHLKRMLLAGVVAAIAYPLSCKLGSLVLLPFAFLLAYPLFIGVMLATVPGQTGMNDFGPPPGNNVSKRQGAAAPGNVASPPAGSGFGRRASAAH